MLACKPTIKQRGDYDCALCCVAMALGKPLDELFTAEQFAEAEQRRSTAPGDLLVELGLTDGIDFRSVYLGAVSESKGNVLQLLHGRKALLQVQSLNNPPPAKHIIYWDGYALHDPSNKQVYRWLEQCVTVGYVTIFMGEA